MHENNDGGPAAHAHKNGEEDNMDANVDEQSADTQDKPGALGQVEAYMDTRYSKHSGHYNLRVRRHHNYSHLFVRKIDDYQYPIQRAIYHTNDHHSASSGTPGDRDTKHISANQDPKIRAPACCKGNHRCL